MSQHVSGEIGQTLRQDYGEFVTIGDIRVRKELISSYLPLPITQKIEGQSEKWIVNIYAGAWMSAAFESDEERQKTLQRLDWIYKKDEAK